MDKLFTSFLTATMAAMVACEVQAQTFDSNGFAEDAEVGATIDQKYQKPELNNGVYEIKNAGQLYWFFCQTTQEVDPNDTTGHISKNPNKAKLTADIRINNSVANGDEGELRNWVLLTEYKDSADYTFRGSFNGNGHTIDGIWCNSERGGDASLFNVVAEGGNVKNLTIGSDSKFFASNCAAPVAIHSYGNIISIINKAAVNAGVAGGIVAECGSRWFKGCQNYGDIHGDNVAGGICAITEDGYAQECVNHGNVWGRYYTGGICGLCGNSGGIENCLNTGAISGAFSVGGIVGVLALEEEGDALAEPNMFGCSNIGEVSSLNQEAGGCVAQCDSGNISNCYFLQTESLNDGIAFCNDLLLGSDSSEESIGGAMNEEQYASGEVAWALGSAWGQNIDNGEEQMPCPEPNNAARVYKVDLLSCSGSGKAIGETFSNTDEPKIDSHHFDASGVCTVEGCGAKKTALPHIDADGGNVETYDLTGRRIDGMARGLVIRRQGGKSRLAQQ